MSEAPALITNRSYRLLMIIVLFMHLASYLVIPILPIFLQKMRALTIAEVGIVLGVGSVAYQAGSLLGGLLSDRFGRRSVMVSGAIVQGLAMVGYSYSQAYLLYLLFSTVNGLGVGLLAPTMKAMIADAVTDQQRTAAFSWRGIFAHLGIIIAGLTITWLTVTNHQPFLYAAFVYFVLAAISRFTLPYDRCVGADCSPASLADYKLIMQHRSFMIFSVITMLIWAFYAQFALVMPLRGEFVLGSPARVGLIWTINSITVVLLQGAIARFLLRRLNPYISMVMGTFMIGAGLFAMGYATHFVTLSASAILFIIGEMLFMPVIDSLVGYFANTKLLGSYFGFSNFASGIGTAIGTSLGGQLMQRLGGVGSRSPWITYGIVAIFLVSLLGLFALYAMPRYQRNAAPDVETLKRRANAK